MHKLTSHRGRRARHRAGKGRGKKWKAWSSMQKKIRPEMVNRSGVTQTLVKKYFVTPPPKWATWPSIWILTSTPQGSPGSLVFFLSLEKNIEKERGPFLRRTFRPGGGGVLFGLGPTIRGSQRCCDYAQIRPTTEKVIRINTTHPRKPTRFNDAFE